MIKRQARWLEVGVNNVALVAVIACTVCRPTSSAHGQIVRDGTIGPPGPGALTGPAYQIPANLGETSGTNLFHSFSQFDLAPGDSATFTGPADISHVLTRVTNGAPSSIQGTIRTEGMPGVNLVLINPAGVIFGDGASLDVPGSFIVTTADVVHLADGGRFNAGDLGASVLTTAEPNAFGFINENPAAILANRADLEVSTGRVISVVGGDVEAERTTLSAPSGRINIVSVASAGQVSLDPTTIDSPIDTGGAALGRVEIVDKSSVETSGDPGGTIVVRAGRLEVNGSSTIVSDTQGSQDGLPITIHVTDEIILTDQGRVRTRVLNTGRGGDIEVAADLIEIESRSFITAETFSTGQAGNVYVQAGNLRIRGDDTAFVTGVRTQTASPTTSGVGGDLTLEVTGSVELTGRGQIAAVTFGASDAGQISLAANELIVSGGAAVIAQTNGAGSGGRVLLDAQTIELTGVGDEGLNTGVLAESTASGKGGNIEIRAGTLTVNNAAAVSAITTGAGNGGTITVRAGEVLSDGFGLLEAFTGIAVNTRAAPDGGNAGNIDVQADEIQLINGSGIAANTFGAGDGGNIRIEADRLTIDNVIMDQETGINASAIAPATGRGGNIEIVVGRSLLDNGASIEAVSSGTGNAGEISIQGTGSFVLRNASHVSSSADNADGGDIFITSGGKFSLLESSVTASAAGDGGNISINSQDHILARHGTISGRSGGDGAAITLGAPVVVLDRSLIDGIAGGTDVLVTINTDSLLSSGSQILTDTAVLPPQLDLAGTLNALQGSLASDRVRLRDSCAVLQQGRESNFRVVGQGGTPAEPRGYFPAWGVVSGHAPGGGDSDTTP